MDLEDPGSCVLRDTHEIKLGGPRWLGGGKLL